MNAKLIIRMVLAGGILSGISARAATEINYWLWDDNQLPSYKACAHAFVDEAKEPGGTFFLPISEHASDIVRILRANFDAIFLEGSDVETTLKAANKEVNSLFD